MNKKYEAIADAVYPFPSRHPKMAMIDRGAQFSPFAALTGYDEAVKETARLTDSRRELTEDEKARLNDWLLAAAAAGSTVQFSFTYFEPDDSKPGGHYITHEGSVKKLDSLCGTVLLTDGTMIPIVYIMDIEPAAF